jgi:hypothetical protein
VDRHNNWDGAPSGNAAAAMAVRSGRLALAQLSLRTGPTLGSGNCSNRRSARSRWR